MWTQEARKQVRLKECPLVSRRRLCPQDATFHCAPHRFIGLTAAYTNFYDPKPVRGQPQLVFFLRTIDL